MLRYLHLFLPFVLLLLNGQLFPLAGQHLTVEGSADEQAIIDRYVLPAQQADSLSIDRAVLELVSNLQRDGYFQAHVSNLTRLDSLHWKASVTTGHRYAWAFLSPGNLDPVMQEKSGYRERFFLHRPFTYQEIQALTEKVLVAAENEGYPFASVRLSEIDIKNGHVQAEIDYQPGPYITFGKLQIHGTERVKADYLAVQLRVPEGSAYSEKKVKRIAGQIRALPFLELLEAVSVKFQNDEAVVHLSLSDRESSQLDGLLNFLPNENKPGTLLLTGQAEILLNNLMRSGKQLSLEWRRLQLETQQLALSYQHPYLFRSPLAAGFSFQLLKEDTLFLNRRLGFQLSYPVADRAGLSLDTELHNSSHLGEGTLVNGESSSGQVGNFNTLSTHLSLDFNRLDDVLFPSSGIHMNGAVGLGRKVLQAQGSEQGWSGLFWQPQARFMLRQYYRIGDLWVLHHRLTGAFVHSEALFLNELYRLGGLRSLRGFNDNFFFASYYALSNLEVRLLLEQTEQAQSYLYAFYDQAFLGHTLVGGSAYQDVPLGLGAGLSLSTRAGIFSLAYALGKTRSTNLDPALSKIHFGYISRF